MQIPRFIALCGAPKAGKSTIAEILATYGGVIVDDGKPLRQAAMALYDLTWEDVRTQEGKAKVLEICGKRFTVRQLLGDLGNLLEGYYGEQFIPERAIASIAGSDAPFFVFPSVRKTQGLTYRQHGGLVIEVTRPDCFPVHDFDHYDKSLVNYVVQNDCETEEWKEELKRSVAELVEFHDF